MRIILSFVVACISFLAVARAAEAPPPNAPPAWFLEEIAALAANGGRWIADNSAYKSEQEPYDAYGVEWKSSFDGTTLSGRLFGLKDGKEIGDFWEFRQYWHPGRKEAVLEQFGWGGTVGAGRMWREGDKTKTDQTFFTVDGGAARSGHLSAMPDASTQVTESFDIKDDAWTARRRYVWKRAPGGQ
ncbi:MAG: hypothetical protein WD076_06650 [Parvularculaceae bacterium]